MRPSVTSGFAPTAALLAGGVLATGAAIDVERGDTLSEIAEAHGVGIDALAQANDVADHDHILAGARLALPAGADATPPAPARADVEALLERTAIEHGWSPAFVKAVAWQESGWRQDRVSSAGAIGIMQVLPGTGEFVGAHLAGRPLDLDDPADNVEAGVRFLDYVYGLTGGDPRMTLAGYYQGLASVEANGMYDDTERYIDNVLALRERFR